MNILSEAATFKRLLGYDYSTRKQTYLNLPLDVIILPESSHI